MVRTFALALAFAGCLYAGGAVSAEPERGVASKAIAVGEPNPAQPPAVSEPVIAPSGVSKFDKKLDLGNWQGAINPDDLSGAFAAQIDARYGPEPGLLGVKADLQANGFTCRDVAPVEARPDYLVATCEKQEMHQGCGNIWSVSLRFDHNSRALDSTRIIPRGGFERLCLGAK